MIKDRRTASPPELVDRPIVSLEYGPRDREFNWENRSVAETAAIQRESGPASQAASSPAIALARPVAGLRRADGPARRHASSCADGRDPRRAGPERRRQDHPAAGPGDPAPPHRRRGLGARLRTPSRGLEGSRPDRLPRPRAALLPRPHLRREPALPGPPARARGRGRGADRRAAGPGEDVALGRRAGPKPLRRHGAAARRLPCGAPRPRAAAARRAALPPRPRGGGPGRAADRPRPGAHPRRRHPRDRGRVGRGRPRPGAASGGSGGLPGPRERAVGRRRPGDLRGRAVRPRTSSLRAFEAILAKDLRVELRTLQSVPAMVLFAVTTFVLFRYGLDRERAQRQPRRGGAAGDGPVRRHPRDQPPVRRRARRGRLRRDPPGARGRHRAVGGEGDGAGRLPAGPGGDRAARVRGLLPRLVGRAGAAGGRPALADLGLAATGVLVSSIAANSRARDLLGPLVLLPLLVPRDDRRRRRRRAAARRRGAVIRRDRQMAGDPRPLRCDLPPGRIRRL